MEDEYKKGEQIKEYLKEPCRDCWNNDLGVDWCEENCVRYKF